MFSTGNIPLTVITTKQTVSETAAAILLLTILDFFIIKIMNIEIISNKAILIALNIAFLLLSLSFLFGFFALGAAGILV